MRVLHLAAGNLYGGVETFLTTLAGSRNACPGMEPGFGVCFAGRLSEELEGAGVPVHRLGAVRLSRPWTAWQARRRLRRLLRDGGYDVVVCHECWPHAVFAPAARRCGIPTAFWAHDTHSGTHWLERWARRTRPDLILVNSRWSQSHLGNLFPGLPSEVLCCPVADRAPADRDEVRRSVRVALGTPEGAVVIVQASRLERWKGHELLLDALGRLGAVPGWECWIAGGAQRPAEEEYLNGLRARARALGLAERVRFLGQRSDVPRLLAAADIHCQPNTGPEPFGIAFVEALYAALPVVTTALGGALEIVDESCGELVPPGDASALAAALKRLLCDPDRRARLGAAGPSQARQLCDVRGQLCRLNDLLARVSRP